MSASDAAAVARQARDYMVTTVWTAVNPETCLPVAVIPLEFYEGLEAEYNERMAEIEDYQAARVAAKLHITDYGVRIAELKLENAELRASLIERGVESHPSSNKSPAGLARTWLRSISGLQVWRSRRNYFSNIDVRR